MRVRCPSPFDLSHSRTSASIRTVVSFLIGRKNSFRRMAVAHRSGGSGFVSGSSSRRRSRVSYNARASASILIPFRELTGVRSLLILICLSRRNDSDDLPVVVGTIHKYRQEQRLRNGVAERVVPHFALELAILNHDQVRIEEYLFRRFEADAMLREIALGFLRVPDEFDFQPLSL